MKATKSTVTTVPPVPQTMSVSSFKDAAYQSAVSQERAEAIAAWVLDKCPSILDSIPDEIKKEIESGFALRWQENNPAAKYTIEWAPSPTGIFEVSLAYCMSYSQQAFGQMKNDEPVKHSIIKSVRDAWSKYRYNRTKGLLSAVKNEMSKRSGSKPKEPTKSFLKYLDETFALIKARCKTAAARGDDSAPTEPKLRMAIDSFKKALDD